MTSVELINLQIELSILDEVIDFFKCNNYFPSTFDELVSRRDDIKNMCEDVQLIN